MRTQEASNSTPVNSDYYKKFVVGETIALRQNYEKTRQENFSGAIKIQEVNEVNIPVMDFKVCREQFAEHSEQLKRRVICARVGRARYVKDPEEVDHAAGKFLYIPQQKLADFLSDPMTGNIFLVCVCVPAFKQKSIAAAQQLVSDPGKISKRFETDTEWLVSKMLGCDIWNAVQPGITIEDDDFLIQVHESLPKQYSTVLPYRIERCEAIVRGKHGNRS